MEGERSLDCVLLILENLQILIEDLIRGDAAEGKDGTVLKR